MSDEFDIAAQCNYQAPPFKAGDHVMLKLGNKKTLIILSCLVAAVTVDPMGCFAYHVRFPSGQADTFSEHEWCKVVAFDQAEYDRFQYGEAVE